MDTVAVNKKKQIVEFPSDIKGMRGKIEKTIIGDDFKTVWKICESENSQYIDGEKYVGKTRKGKRQGRGTVYGLDGELSYSGTFKNGHLDGQGTQKY